MWQKKLTIMDKISRIVTMALTVKAFKLLQLRIYIEISRVALYIISIYYIL
jgi:hypothetical protein